MITHIYMARFLDMCALTYTLFFLFQQQNYLITWTYIDIWKLGSPSNWKENRDWQDCVVPIFKGERILPVWEISVQNLGLLPMFKC